MGGGGAGHPAGATPQVQRGRRRGGGDGEGLGAITPPAPSPQPPSPSIHKAHGKVQQARWVVMAAGHPAGAEGGGKGGVGELGAITPPATSSIHTHMLG